MLLTWVLIGALLEEQVGRDLGVALALGDQEQDVAFARAERVEEVVGVRGWRKRRRTRGSIGR